MEAIGLSEQRLRVVRATTVGLVCTYALFQFLAGGAEFSQGATFASVFKGRGVRVLGAGAVGALVCVGVKSSLRALRENKRLKDRRLCQGAGKRGSSLTQFKMDLITGGLSRLGLRHVDESLRVKSYLVQLWSAKGDSEARTVLERVSQCKFPFLKAAIIRDWSQFGQDQVLATHAFTKEALSCYSSLVGQKSPEEKLKAAWSYHLMSQFKKAAGGPSEEFVQSWRNVAARYHCTVSDSFVGAARGIDRREARGLPTAVVAHFHEQMRNKEKVVREFTAFAKHHHLIGMSLRRAGCQRVDERQLGELLVRYKLIDHFDSSPFPVERAEEVDSKLAVCTICQCNPLEGKGRWVAPTNSYGVREYYHKACLSSWFERGNFKLVRVKGKWVAAPLLPNSNAPYIGKKLRRERTYSAAKTLKLMKKET